MSTRLVSKELQRRTEAYYAFKASHSAAFAESDVLADLPTYLRVELRYMMHKEKLEKMPMLQRNQSGFLKAISAQLQVSVLLPGDYAVRKKQLATAAFFLVSEGRLEVSGRFSKVRLA